MIKRTGEERGDYMMHLRFRVVMIERRLEIRGGESDGLQALLWAD